MIPDKILYTDGHDVVITESTFQVKNKSYSLSGITKHGLQTLGPDRIPGILIFTVGTVLAMAGILRWIPESWMNGVTIDGEYITINTMAAWTGLAIALIGILTVSLVKERYAVRIATAEGEKDAVISRKKEYVRQIVQALNEAYTFVRGRIGSR